MHGWLTYREKKEKFIGCWSNDLQKIIGWKYIDDKNVPKSFYCLQCKMKDTGWNPIKRKLDFRTSAYMNPLWKLTLMIAMMNLTPP